MNHTTKTREHEGRIRQQERRKKHRKGKAAQRGTKLPPATIHLTNQSL